MCATGFAAVDGYFSVGDGFGVRAGDAGFCCGAAFYEVRTEEGAAEHGEGVVCVAHCGVLLLLLFGVGRCLEILKVLLADMLGRRVNKMLLMKVCFLFRKSSNLDDGGAGDGEDSGGGLL